MRLNLLSLSVDLWHHLLELGSKSRISTQDCDSSDVFQPARVWRTPSHRDLERRRPFSTVGWRMQGKAYHVQFVSCLLDVLLVWKCPGLDLPGRTLLNSVAPIVPFLP